MNKVIMQLTEKYEQSGYGSAKEYFEGFWSAGNDDVPKNEKALVAIFMVKLALANNDTEMMDRLLRIDGECNPASKKTAAPKKTAVSKSEVGSSIEVGLRIMDSLRTGYHKPKKTAVSKSEVGQ